MADVPPAPIRPLEGAGLELWNRVWGMGRSWLSQTTDIDLLQMVCEQSNERIVLMSLLDETQSTEHRKALRELERNIVANLQLLGFTPLDRSRLGVAEVMKLSKVEELRAKHQAS